MELLKRLLAASAPSGSEGEAAEIIEKYLSGYADEIYKDALGNVIAHKKGGGAKIMLLCHMDEKGFAVKYVNDSGRVYFVSSAMPEAKLLLGRRVIFENGARGVIWSEKKDDITLSDLYVDLTGDKKVNIGDTFTVEKNIFSEGDYIFCAAAGDRATCEIAADAIINSNGENDIYAVFASRHHIGGKGAKTAAFSLKCDIIISLDTENEGNISLSKGPALKYMCKSLISNRELLSFMENAAKEEKIPYQKLVSDSENASALLSSLVSGNAKSAAVSLPVRYAESDSECVSASDIENEKKLILKIIGTKTDL